jgi:diamine N-acetyltransferase
VGKTGEVSGVTIELREITRENWRQCARLQVREDQRNFVAPNTSSLAQAAYEKELLPLAVYDGDTLVGFVMYAREPSPEWGYFILRLMVDEAYQGKGYGRAVIVEVLRRLGLKPDCREVHISEVPENVVAARLYESLGFVRTGQVVHGEDLMKYTFPDRNPSKT